MGATALALAVASLGLLAWPAVGMYVALGLAIAAMGLGWVGYRRSSSRTSWRLCGAGAVTLGTIALLLAGTKIAATALALARIAERI